MIDLRKDGRPTTEHDVQLTPQIQTDAPTALNSLVALSPEHPPPASDRIRRPPYYRWLESSAARLPNGR